MAEELLDGIRIIFSQDDHVLFALLQVSISVCDTLTTEKGSVTHSKLAAFATELVEVGVRVANDELVQLDLALVAELYGDVGVLCVVVLADSVSDTLVCGKIVTYSAFDMVAVLNTVSWWCCIGLCAMVVASRSTNLMSKVGICSVAATHSKWSGAVSERDIPWQTRIDFARTLTLLFRLHLRFSVRIASQRQVHW